MLQVKAIEKYYGSKNNVTKALDRVSFDVAEGEFIAIMGASGSGKTTLLNCIATIDTVSAGHILLSGEDIASLPPKELARFRREKLGFVFQDFNLLDTLTLKENIGLALTINHTAPTLSGIRYRTWPCAFGSTISWTNSLTRSPAGRSSGRHAPGPWWQGSP